MDKPITLAQITMFSYMVAWVVGMSLFLDMIQEEHDNTDIPPTF